MAPHEPARQSLIRRFTPPVWTAGGKATYLLGTDQVGRDILSRMIHGARVSLIVGVAAVLVSLLVGVTLGLLSGFLQGRVDTVIMTVVDVTLSFPQLLLALAFVAALGPSLLTIIVVLGLTGWERYTRVVRAEVLALREKDFVEAARAIGASPTRTLLRHLLPNTFSSIIVMSTLQVAQAILQEAALSFLGVGTGSAYPTWGQMIALGPRLRDAWPGGCRPSPAWPSCSPCSRSTWWATASATRWIPASSENSVANGPGSGAHSRNVPIPGPRPGGP